ncbi:hypothetical protein BJ917_1358 [Pseudomonas sp. WPR_5_2]|nr:hypothetical protein BJ917_1358 [Pseudomonas sp. WPR_5_2]
MVSPLRRGTFFKRQKSTQKGSPRRPAPRQGSGFLRSGIHPGTLPSGWLRCTYMQRVRLRRTALRATPRMNTSTQPPEGAGGSKAKAKRGELTLDLLWRTRPILCGSWLVGAPHRSDGGLTANLSLRMNAFPCRSEPAREKRPDNAGIQAARVIVDVLRWQASSYRESGTLETIRSAVRPPRFGF